MAKRVYVVYTTTGKYEDVRTVPVRAFIRKATANKFVEKKNEELKNYGLHASQIHGSRASSDMPKFDWIDWLTGGAYYLASPLTLDEG